MLIAYAEFVIGFETSEIIVNENAKFVEVNVSIIEGATELPFNITYMTSDGTATSSTSDTSDFTSIKETISFIPLQLYTTISIPITDDSILEENEFFFVELTDVSFAQTSETKVRVTIIDDDGKS